LIFVKEVLANAASTSSSLAGFAATVGAQQQLSSNWEWSFYPFFSVRRLGIVRCAPLSQLIEDDELPLLDGSSLCTR